MYPDKLELAEVERERQARDIFLKTNPLIKEWIKWNDMLNSDKR